MIVVDTSVWVAALRARASTEAAELRQLLDADRVALAAPVRVEILAGTSVTELPRLRRLLSALPLWLPTDATWRRMESWLEPAIAAGERFGVGDLLIGAIAAEAAAPVWSLDSDFRRLARLGLVELHPWA